MPAALQFDLVLDLKAEVAESPLWDAGRGVLWLVDITGGRVLGVDPRNGHRQEYQFRESVGSLGLCQSGRLLVALKHSLMVFEPESGTRRLLARLPDEPEANRLNDGKVGPDGAFWVGSITPHPTAEDATLYRITPDGRVERKVEGLRVSNGLAWSPDGRCMYHADSRHSWIDAWDFDAATGQISNRRRLASLSAEEGRPDGAACDAAGNYWSAGVSAGALNVFSPDGALLQRHAMPVPAPTMPCFGGPGLDELFITSLRSGRDAALLERFPASGGLHRGRWVAEEQAAGSPCRWLEARSPVSRIDAPG